MRDSVRRVTVLAAAFVAVGLIAVPAVTQAGAAQDPCATPLPPQDPQITDPDPPAIDPPSNGGVDLVAPREPAAPPDDRAAAQRCVTVPDVVGLEVDEARRVLRLASLDAEVSDPAGEVEASNPAAGTRVVRGSIVSLSIDLPGPTPDPTPDPTPGPVDPEPDPRPGPPVVDATSRPLMLIVVAVLAGLALALLAWRLARRAIRRRSDHELPPSADPVVTMVPAESRSTVTTDPGNAPTVTIAIEIHDVDPHRELIRSRP